MKKIFQKREIKLEYYLSQAKSKGARLYWIGRLDELSRLKREFKKF